MATRERGRLRRVARSGLVALVAVAGCWAPVGPADAATARTTVLDCQRLRGQGTYADPSVVGAITRVTRIRNCAPLAVGYGYNVRYFSFTLVSAASAKSVALTYYRVARPAGVGGVWPAVFNDDAWQERDEFASLYLNDGTYEGRYHWLQGLPAAPYRLRVEKPSSAMAALTSASYNVLITP